MKWLNHKPLKSTQKMIMEDIKKKMKCLKWMMVVEVMAILEGISMVVEILVEISVEIFEEK